MSLLHEIQASLLGEGQKIGPILLKLQFLASRLGSAPLEAWVKHEADGYPTDAEVPDYRLLPVSYTANFSGPFGSGVRNAPIPPYLIDKFAGPGWNQYEIRQSIAAIDDLIDSAGRTDRGNLQINASNLILMLQGNVYTDYACNSVTGSLSKASLSELQNSVRTRVLELTIQLERALPSAVNILLGPMNSTPTPGEIRQVSNITKTIVYGNQTTISNSGHGAQFNFRIGERNADEFAATLTKAGIAKEDAEELTKIVTSEEPEDQGQPFGARAKEWIARNINKAMDGTWKVGVAVATSVLTEAALQYYGLKQP